MDFSIDFDLVKRARSQPEALDALVTAIWPEIYRVALGIVRASDAAEDAAQDACASIARSLPSLKDDGAFYGWMYRIAGRCAVAAAKQRARTARFTPAAAEAAGDLDRTIDLRASLERLPLAQRSAIVLHYYGGLSSFEIGAALNVPAATVRFHLMLGRRTLRKLMHAGSPAAKETCENV